MYAKSVWKDIVRKRIALTPENLQKLMCEFGIARNTTLNYLNDIANEAVTAPKRNDVVIAAINKYHGRMVEERVPKYVVEIDEDDCPENHIDDR